MKLGSARVLDRLVAEELCYGAVFCSYSFDPAYFEEQVLRAVLRLSSDPQEQPLRFHGEAVRALQTTPVACIVDAGMRQPGHKLPYDLLDVHARVFHPKLALLLFDEFARLHIGSGNLTRGGFGGNTELFFIRDLHYDDADSAAVLREVDEFLADIGGLTKNPGTQLGLVRDELARRMGSGGAEPRARSCQFLCSTREAILPRFLDLIPADARVTRVGVLAPFFERDDADAAISDELSSVLTTLVKARPKSSPTLDVGLLWDDMKSATAATANATLDEGLGRLWSWNEGTEKDASINYITPVKLTANQVEYEDRRGERRRRPRGELEKAIQEGRARPVEGLSGFAPRKIIKMLSASGVDLHVWLHPARRFEDGVSVNRPLHAKLFTIAIERRRQELTYVLVGSPNASRRALLQGPAQGGNVETAVAFVLEGSHAIADFAPELVHGRLESMDLVEREFPESLANLSLWIESAVHDAEQRTLTITWAKEGPAPLGPYQLFYTTSDKPIAVDDGAPTHPTVVVGFTLVESSCELVLSAGEREFTIPITVRDLAMLPASPALMDLELRELLALLGRRIGAERIEVLRSNKNGIGMAPVLEAIFGDGFGPVDVFKAWWGISGDLEDHGLSVPAFRLVVLGPIGAAAVWKRMREAVGVLDGLTRDEAWFYGAELLDTLSHVNIPEDPRAAAKRAILMEFLTALRGDLEDLVPAEDGRPWMRRILQHYGVQP
ncbi:MAG: hypothetical protein HUU21_04890 [Polyangiaceae bacterium]|nr:hypothetical protein [Polyangiaceae bacterium]